MPHRHDAIGNQFKEAAQRLRFTQHSLAKAAGVSRRHVVFALNGGNVTLEVTRRLMRTLQMSELVIGEASRVVNACDELDPSVLVLIAERMDHGLATVAEAVTALRVYATARRDAPSDDTRRAAALVKEVTSRVRRRKAPATAEALQAELARASDDDDVDTPRRRSR